MLTLVKHFEDTASEGSLSIDDIESALSEMGLTTSYTGDDDFTSYLIDSSAVQIEILDGVSGDYFRSAHVTEVNVYYNGNWSGEATSKFEDVETVEDFLSAVRDILPTD